MVARKMVVWGATVEMSQSITLISRLHPDIANRPEAFVFGIAAITIRGRLIGRSIMPVLPGTKRFSRNA
jgi:hypothetical protein